MNPQKIHNLFKEQSLIADTLPLHLWFMTDVDTCGRLNRALADYLGLDKSDIEFKRLEEFLPPDAAAVCRESNQKVYDTGVTVHTQEWLVGAQGQRRLFAITKTPLFAEDGSGIERIICYGVDITEQHQAEQHQARSEANFRNFIEALDDIVLIGDQAGRIKYANPAATEKLGYSTEEFRELDILHLHPEWVRREAEKILADMFAGKRETCPLPLQSKSGHLIPVETRIRFGDWNGETCIFGTSKDLSKQQELLQKFEKLFRTNPALMAISDVPGRRFTDVNETFLRILGYDEDEVLGKTTRELGLFPDPKQQDEAALELSRKGYIRDIEMKIKGKDGKILTGLFSGEAVESQGENYFLTVMVDITDRKRVEKEREEIIQELQAAIEQIKTLRGIVPICSSCKKIRDDEGYWEQVEGYLARHTHAEFSHGICPECLKQLYPGYEKGS
jgi:PAS domain S-box-containing protein